MKKKIILGLLFLVLFLFFMTTSWALDYDSYLKSRYQERPDQELFRTPVVPQTSTPLQFMTKILFIPIGQTLPALIYVKQYSIQTQEKMSDSVKNSTGTVNKADKTK